MKTVKNLLLASAASIFLGASALPAIAAPVKNIVLVHAEQAAPHAQD